MKRLALLLIPSLLLGGCAMPWSKKKEEPPAELQALASPRPVLTAWSGSSGSGVGEGRARLVPYLTGGYLYTADHKGVVTAWNADNGGRSWQVDTDLPISGGPGAGGGLVLVGTEDAELVALDSANGSEKWRAKLTSELLSVPKADQGVVVVHTIDDKLVGLNAADGSQLWRYERDAPVLTLHGGSSPVLVGGLAICGFSNGKLAALELRSGQLAWETTVALPHGRSDLERMVDIDGDPLVNDGIVHVATYRGNLAAISARDGEVLWRQEISSYNGMAANYRYLYLSNDKDEVVAADPRNGKVVWTQKELKKRRLSPPAAVGNYVVVGDFEGFVHWISQEDGTIVGRTRVGDAPITAQPVVAGDTVYILGDEGDLAALRMGGG